MSEEQKPEQPKSEGEEKLSPAELKKRAKAEKQARRAAAKEGGPPQAGPGGINGEPKTNKQSGGAGAPQQKPKGEKQQSKSPQKQGEQRQGGPQHVSLPTRGRGASQSAGSASKPEGKPQKQENKQVQLFSHLYTQPRRHTIEGVSKDVHPAILALGFQISSYEICGSSARCVAMLLAFKEAFQTYTTPAGTSLARHLTSHYLSPQIDFLKSCRPISESMGNAIRWLKKLIVEIDPNTPEQEAKDYLCESIDKFIQERITVTDQAIAASASLQIKPGSVVLTYAKSSIVEKTILEAHRVHGTQFRVVVVDSPPLFEGKSLAKSLIRAGLQVDYLLFTGLAHAVADATLVLLGAHSMLSNGRLQSRVGTASVAMAAHRADIPVIVCCESVKFSGKVALDSIVLNEVAPPEELLPPPPPIASSPPPETLTTAIATSSSTGPSKPDKKPHGGGDDDGGDRARAPKTLHDWKEIPNLQILNLMYDVTPAEYIRMVICEYGNVPPSSVPVVHRLANEGI